MEGVAARPGAGRIAALIGVVGACACLAALPVLVATGAAAGLGPYVIGLSSLAAVVGGAKLAAMAWGLAASVD